MYTTSGFHYRWQRGLALLLLGVLLSHFAMAAAPSRVVGRVCSVGGDSLAGAVVRVAGRSEHAVSDANGHYELHLPLGEWTLQCSYVGYKSAVQTVRVTKGVTRCDWRLDEESVAVGAVLVAGAGVSQRERQVPMLISVADKQQFKGQVVTLQQVLTQTSGVQALRSGGEGYHARLLVQGLDGKRVGMFVDGVPLGHGATFDLDRIPQELVERVEVYKGVVPPWLGGGGLSGAINVVTRAVEGSHLEAGYAVGSYASHRGYLLGTAHFAEAGVDLSVYGGAHYARNNYQFNSPFESGRIIVRDHDRYLSAQGSVGLRFTKSYFDLLGVSLDYNYGFKEQQGGMMNLQNNVQHAFTRMQAASLSGMARKAYLGGRLTFDLSLHGSYGVGNVVDTSMWAYNFLGERYLSPGGRGEVGMLPNFSHDVYIAVNGQLNARYEISLVHILHCNVTHRYSRQQPEDTLAARYSTFVASGLPNSLHAFVGGASYELRLFEGSLRNILGAKGYYFRDEMWATSQPFALEISPHSQHASFSWGFVEALSWQPWQQLTLKASLQLQSRLPTSFELFGDGMSILPGYQLRPERSLNTNLGLVWLINGTGYPHARVDLQGFYMQIRDLIQLTMGFAFNLLHRNIMQASGYGADGEVEVHWLPYLSTRANATYYRLTNRMALDEQGAPNPLYGMRVPNVPWLFGNVTLDAHMEDPFGIRSYGSLYVSCQGTEEFSYGWEVSRRNQMRVPRKWNLDAGLHISFLGHYHLSFAVRNVLNTEQWEEFRYPIPGRTFHAKLRYTFDFDRNN